MTSAEQDAEICRLHHAEHWRVGTIAAQLGLHPDAVKRVLGIGVPRAGGGSERARMVTPYRVFIDETLARYPRLRATRLWDMLRERGYKGAVRTLREYVAEVRPRPKAEAFLRTEPLIGEQAQVDWAHVQKVAVPGGERGLWLFVIVLAYSRAMWAEFVFDLSVHSLCRSLIRSGEYFGGVTRQWLFDNPKTVVLERHGDAVRFHPVLLELCGAMRVQPRLCAVARPEHKGRVERAVRYLRERFLAGRVITGIEQGNRELLRFLDEIAHPRRHPTLPARTVADVLAEERPRLLALPNPRPPIERVAPVAVDKTACVRLDTNLYSVPAAFAQRTLTLAADDQTVRLLDGATEVARHRRSYGRRQLIEERAHRADLIRERRAARDLKGRDRLRAVAPAIDALLPRWIDSGRSMALLVTRSIKLLDLYGDAIFVVAVDDLVENGLWDPSALAVACEKRRRERALPVPVEVPLPDHVDDREIVPHDLGDYDEDR